MPLGGARTQHERVEGRNWWWLLIGKQASAAEMKVPPWTAWETLLQPFALRCQAPSVLDGCWKARECPMNRRGVIVKVSRFMPILVQPLDCCRPCPPITTTDIPGSPGADGTPGTDGSNGIDSFTLTTAQFTMPTYGGVVTVDVANSSWMVVGQLVFAGLFGSAAMGTFQVNQVPDATHVVLVNLADNVSLYTNNSPPTTNFPSGTQIGPAGQQGPAGTAGAGGAPVNATYVTQTSNATLTQEFALAALPTGLLHTTLGTGADATVLENTSAGGQAPNDGALTAGQLVVASASGIKTDTAANNRTALGLGTMAVQNANAVAITGGTIAGVTLPAPSGLVSSWAVYQYQAATSINGDPFPSGAWGTVPFSDELLDPDGIGTLAANIVTLVAGTYRFRWSVSASAVNEFSTRLVQGVGTVLAYGSNGKASSTDTSQDESQGWWRATVVGGTQVRLEARGVTGGGTYGNATNFGQREVYATLEIEKES